MISILKNVKFVSLNTKLMLFGLLCLIMLGVSFLYDYRSTTEINNISLWLQKAGDLRWQAHENAASSKQFPGGKDKSDSAALPKLTDPKARQMSLDLLDRMNAVTQSPP
ncbi:MAG: hypothetical protein HQK97_13135, partial [Nitrospirae bacterium]|nr:hypothetical protein [Nitrospirota bacterium]